MSDTNTLSIEIEIPSEETTDGVDKKTLNFKPLSVVPVGILRRNRKDRQEQMWAVFEWALSEDDLVLLDQLPSSKLTEILGAMQKASGVELGE